MTNIAIRPACEADASRLNDALARLSAEIGDDHKATAADLLRHGFGPEPVFHAMLADRQGTIAGVAIYSPLFSTVRGGAGLYVSDLWVAPEARGSGLGHGLLRAAAARARRQWRARFLKLSVYDDNHPARAFYERLGFVAGTNETSLILSGAPFEALEGER